MDRHVLPAFPRTDMLAYAT